VDELPAGVVPRLQVVGEITNGLVQLEYLLIIDQGVVDPVDPELLEICVVHLWMSLVMLTAKGLVHILIHDSPGRDDDIYHVVLDHLFDDLSQTAGNEGTSKAQEDGGSVLVREHGFVDLGCGAHVPGLDRHVGEVVHHVRDLHALSDVELFDLLGGTSIGY